MDKLPKENKLTWQKVFIALYLGLIYCELSLFTPLGNCILLLGFLGLMVTFGIIPITKDKVEYKLWQCSKRGKIMKAISLLLTIIGILMLTQTYITFQ